MRKAAVFTAGVLAVAGCASPGPPRAPSLQLPSVVDDLAATRRADTVALRFAIPVVTTEGLPYRAATLRASVCRAVDAGPCVPVPALASVPLQSRPQANGPPSRSSTSGSQTAMAGGSKLGARSSRPGTREAAPHAEVNDALPPALATGGARLLTYRVQLSNEQGRSAGYGSGAYAVAGAAPPAVAGLHAEGSRAGVALRWQPVPGLLKDGGAVVLRRDLVREGDGAADSGPKGPAAPREPGRATASGRGVQAGGSGDVAWLSTTPLPDPLGDSSGGDGDQPAPVAATQHGVLDDGAAVNSTYRYAAERQRSVHLAGHTMIVHSALSAPVEITLQAIYPPPPPSDLVGTAFAVEPSEAAGGRIAVDLIWTAPNQAEAAGFLVYREAVDGSGRTLGPRIRLTATPVSASAWHDLPPITGRDGTATFRYSVTTVDAKGLESTAVSTTVTAAAN